MTVIADATLWDTAHEIGHVLLTTHFSGPAHSRKFTNVMFAFSSRSSRIPTLENIQLAQIRRSVCCVRI